MYDVFKDVHYEKTALNSCNLYRLDCAGFSSICTDTHEHSFGEAAIW